MMPTRKPQRALFSFVSAVLILGVIATDARDAQAETCNQSSPAVCVDTAATLESDTASNADRERAVALYQQACGWEYVPACVLAGHRLRNGQGVVHNPAAAADLFADACSRGNSEGCYMLGFMYSSGEGGLTADPARSRELYLRSCNMGLAWGCFNAAKQLRDGSGGPMDLTGAVERFTKACERGVAESCNIVGNSYWAGKGATKDKLRANMYYTKGCDGDHGWSCFNLGTSYRDGEGVPSEDPVRAVSLLRKACDLDAAEACNAAGVVFHDTDTDIKDLLLAFALFHKACDGGYHWGCHNMAKMYRDGLGIGEDQARGISLFRKACDGGISESCEAIGIAPATPTPQPTTAPQPTPRPTVPPAPIPAPVQAGSQWQRNCRAAWKSSNELVYTVSTQVVDGADESSSLQVERRDLVLLLNELDVTGEPALEQARTTCLRLIEEAPAYDNPLPSNLGGDADMTVTPALSRAMDQLWTRIGIRAKAAGEPCAWLRFDLSADGIMYDSETGLEWLTGSDERTTRDEAVAWVDGLSSEGGTWRMPTKEELMALHEGGLRTHNMKTFLNTTGSWAWTESEESGPPMTWGFNFAREGSMVMNGCNFCDSRALAARTRK